MGHTDAWLVIVNPAAGNARGHSTWRAVADAMHAAGIAFEEVSTSAARAGQVIAAAAVHEGHRRLLVAGGDGSVHDVVNGIFEAIEAGADAAPVSLGVIPLGTGNDWARSLNMPRTPGEIVALVRNDRCVAHDVGRIDFGTRHCWFINVAGAGLDGHVIERLPRRIRSRLAYLAGAMRALRDYRAPLFEIDARPLGHGGATPDATLRGRFLLTFVANGRYCGHRMDIAPDAIRDDGLFEIVAIDAVGLGTVFRKLVKLYRGTLLADPIVHHARGASVRITCSPAVPVEADGQFVGVTPAEFTVLPGALRVLVP